MVSRVSKKNEYIFSLKCLLWKLRKNQEKLLGNQGKIREFHGIKKWEPWLSLGCTFCPCVCETPGYYYRIATASEDGLSDDSVVSDCFNVFLGSPVHTHTSAVSVFLCPFFTALKHVSVCHSVQGNLHVTITHYALGHGYPLWIPDMGPTPSPTTDIWWSSLETC